MNFKSFPFPWCCLKFHDAHTTKKIHDAHTSYKVLVSVWPKHPKRATAPRKSQIEAVSNRNLFLKLWIMNSFGDAPRLIDLMFKMFQRRTQFHHHSRAVQTAAPPTPCPPPPRSASSISSSRCFSSSSTTSTSNPLTGASTCQNKRALN